MLTALLAIVFCLGYLAIALEHYIKINKSASALLTGVICWTICVLVPAEATSFLHTLESHFGEIAGVLFFLLGAMVIVELIDAHQGFDSLIALFSTTSKRILLWAISLATFILSALLDNLTTTIVMITLLRKAIETREDRLLFVGMIIIAANAGGAWSPLGDVTTTMLWIGQQISATHSISSLLLPSLTCLLLPLAALSCKISGSLPPRASTVCSNNPTAPWERTLILCLGSGVLLFVPIFKTITHLPPFMGMLLGLGVMWVITELIHSEKDEAEHGLLSVNHALRKIDASSILFFLGILLAVSSLQASGLLASIAAILHAWIGDLAVISILIGLLSAVVDNVPLVAAVQGMYSLQQFPTDHVFWHFLAYCAGTGGSALLIGSAAGVAAMGLERIEFFWYLRRISGLAVLGYLGGAAVFIAQQGHLF